MNKFAATLVGDAPDIVERVDWEVLPGEVEDSARQLPLLFFLVFKTALLSFEYLVFPFAWKVRPFRMLPLNARLAYMHRWEFGRLSLTRNLYKLVKLVTLTTLLRQPALVDYIGYGPDLSHRQARPGLPADERRCNAPGDPA